MTLATIYDIAGSAMQFQSIRLNTVASNLSNTQSVSRTKENAYKARQPIAIAKPFSPKLPGNHLLSKSIKNNIFSVELAEISKKTTPVEQRYQPDHPAADEQGLVYYSNVDSAHEMASMMAASREFETSVALLTTTRKMEDQLLELINI